jgi:DNA repair protein RadC
MKAAEIKLSYSHKVKASARLQIKSSEDAYAVLLASWDQSQIELVEQFKVLLVDRTHKIIGICTISIGGTTGTVVDPKLIFATALKANAHGMILCHNHPSGTVVPSTADQTLTDKLVAGGKLLDIAILDHLIISREACYSFADEGRL